MIKNNYAFEYTVNCDEKEYDKLLSSLTERIDSFFVDFGELPHFPADYATPPILPTKGEHPRLWVKEKDLTLIRENLTHEENLLNFKRVETNADVCFDGVLPPPSLHTYNYDAKDLAKIESLAFMYLITRDELYGRAAILASKNYLNTIIITDEFHDKRYFAGAAMYVISEVYDWCHSLLSDRDKEQLVTGCVNNLATLFEIGVPPAGQGAVSGHGTGAQLLRNWMAFCIATYDEYPDIYLNVLGRFFEQYIDAPNFYYKSGINFQGSSYGPGKTVLNILSELLIHNMSGKYLYDFSFKPVVTSFLNYLRPDGEQLRVGDDYMQHSKGRSACNDGYGTLAFFGASLYDDPVFKAWAIDLTDNFRGVAWNGEFKLTPVTFLILNKPWLGRGDKYSLPTVTYNGSPTGQIIARSSWGDKDAWMTYTKIGEAYAANHEHKDAGAFQIYYKGILAMTSACYEYYYRDLYGSLLDCAYGKQSISKNCLLIYNHEYPAPQNSWDSKWVNSGGQRFRGEANGENGTLARWLEKSTSHQAKVLGHEYALDGASPSYVYISGDITNAYDEITVDDVVRSTMTVATKDPEHPMMFVVYDRITSKKPNYRKTFLLHTPQEPKIDGEYITVTNTERGNNGKLVNRTLLPEKTKVTVIGGDGKRFFVDWHNVADEHRPSDPNWDRQEIGWGRVEISPEEYNLSDRFLNLMYVTDADRDEDYIPSSYIECETHEGVIAFNKVVLFSKTTEKVTSSIEFELESSADCHIAGLSSGEWNLSANGEVFFKCNVTESGTLAVFHAPAGKIKLEPVN